MCIWEGTTLLAAMPLTAWWQLVFVFVWGGKAKGEHREHSNTENHERERADARSLPDFSGESS